MLKEEVSPVVLLREAMLKLSLGEKIHLGGVIGELEEALLLEALNAHGQNRQHASMRLGISRTCLVEKLKKLGHVNLRPRTPESL